MTLSPQDHIFQELSSFALSHELNLGVREIRIFSQRIFHRLNGELLNQAEAAQMLGVSMDMVHLYRKSGYLTGIRKNPTSKRIHWLYSLAEVLEFKAARGSHSNQTGTRRRAR